MKQIEQLKTELREFIKLSETITPGEWKSDGYVEQWRAGEFPAVRVSYQEEDCISSPVCMVPLNMLGWGAGSKNPVADAAFIARSRSISPAMAKCLLVAVETLGAYAEYDELRLKGLNSILAIWEAAK